MTFFVFVAGFYAAASGLGTLFADTVQEITTINGRHFETHELVLRLRGALALFSGAVTMLVAAGVLRLPL